MSWRLEARTGATTPDIRARLEALDAEGFDLAVTALAADLAQEEDALHLPLVFIGEVEGMARDGFHPGPPIYRAWAERVDALAG